MTEKQVWAIILTILATLTLFAYVYVWVSFGLIDLH